MRRQLGSGCRFLFIRHEADSAVTLHPATQILFWGLLVAVMQFLPATRLLVLSGLVLFLAFLYSRQKLKQLLRRTRWFMISLWLIYAYTTPGEVLFDSLLSPTREGLASGGLQAMRLLAALAGLAMLLGRLHRQQLMAGIHALVLPLQWLGLSRERLAVRLALTLHYAEVGMLRPASFKHSLMSLDSEGEKMKAEDRILELPVYRFASQDALLLSSALLISWLAMQ